MGSEGSKSFDGCNSRVNWEQLQYLNGSKIILAGIIITPLKQRQTFMEVGSGLHVGGLVGSMVTFFAFPPAALVSSAIGLIAMSARLISEHKMFHFTILLGFGDGNFLTFSYGEDGIQWKIRNNLPNQYEKKQDYHPQHYFDYHYIHKEDGWKSIIETFYVKQNIYLRDVQAIMKSVQYKKYNISNWNCKDFTNYVINSIKKVN